jgi:hypothetical protein
MLCTFGGRIETPSLSFDRRGAECIADPHRLNVTLTRA